MPHTEHMETAFSQSFVTACDSGKIVKRGLACEESLRLVRSPLLNLPRLGRQFMDVVVRSVSLSC